MMHRNLRTAICPNVLKKCNYQTIYNLLCVYGFLPLIIHPTRIVENQEPSLIDNIYSNNVSDEIVSGNIYLTLSEHLSQFASIKRDKLDTKNIKIFERDYSKYCEKDYYDDVSIQNWNYNLDNSSDLMSDFIWKLNGCVDRHAPIKQLSAKQAKLKLKPWISTELVKMIKIRDKLDRRRKRQPNNEQVKQLYNIFRNRINRELKKAKNSTLPIILMSTETT